MAVRHESMNVLDEAENKVLVPLVVSAPDLVELVVSDNRLVVADVRWYLDGRDARRVHDEGHVPGAVFVDVDSDLSEPGDATDGRHRFPSPERFAASMSRLGIGDATYVVAYDDTGGMSAARLVVMLRMLGRSASLLDGGIDAWRAATESRLETGPSRPRSGVTFTATPWPTNRLATTADVEAFVDRPGRTVLLDARASDRFRGEPHPLDPRPGHVPGAFNAPWTAVLESGSLRDRDELRRHFTELCVDIADDVIVSCGSGVSACLDVLAVEEAGFAPPRLYVASWSGWASDPEHAADTAPTEPDRARFDVDDSIGFAAVASLRRARRRRRLVDLEWFEALYRVYLAAFVFGGGALFVSGFVRDDPASDGAATDFWRHAPGWIGVVAAVAVWFGARSGRRGGPLALEEADVRHVLLAPVDIRRVLLRPALQRWRTIAFGAAAAGALAGQLAGRRLPGTEFSWALSGAAAGALVATLFVGSALATHATHDWSYVVVDLAAGLTAWQIVSALPTDGATSGPFDSVGRLALWGWEQHAADLTGVVLAIVVMFIGLAFLGRLSLEAQARRSSLVSQLRFAVTLQDLRTVVLLRRQLGHERERRRPWFTIGASRWFGPEIQRSWRGLVRFPVSRLVRLVVLAAVVGASAGVVLTGTTPLVVLAGIASFVLGLDLVEPLAQEVDHVDRTDSYPIERGPTHVRLLVPSTIVALVATGVVVAVGGFTSDGRWSTVAIASLATLVAGVAGAAVSIVAGTPDPLSSTAQNNVMPPEVAGTANVVKAVWPVAVATVGQIPLLVARSAEVSGEGVEAAATRALIAVVLFVALAFGWIHRRDAIRNWLKTAAEESRPNVKGVR